MILHELLDLIRTYIPDVAAEKIFDTSLVRYLNTGIKDFCLNTKIFNTKIAYTSVAGQGDYDLKSADGTELFEVEHILYDKKKLDTMTPDKLFQTSEFQDTEQGTPLVFTSFNSLSITLYPIPEEGGKDIEIFGRGLPATASYFTKTALNGVSPIGSEWDIAFVYFAVIQAMLSIGDRLKAGEFRNEYNKQVLMAIRKAKRKIHYRYSFFPEGGLQ